MLYLNNCHYIIDIFQFIPIIAIKSLYMLKYYIFFKYYVKLLSYIILSYIERCVKLYNYLITSTFDIILSSKYSFYIFENVYV